MGNGHTILFTLVSLVISIYTFCWVLDYELGIDFKAWKDQNGTRHIGKPLKRVAMLLPSIVGLTIIHPWPWYFSIGIVLAIEGCTWWLLFDGLYNRIRGFDWWFNGGHNDPTEPDDSWLDKWLSKLSDDQERLVKIGGLIMTAGFYVLTFFHYKFIL